VNAIIVLINGFVVVVVFFCAVDAGRDGCDGCGDAEERLQYLHSAGREGQTQ
jgi:hypothetical protein